MFGGEGDIQVNLKQISFVLVMFFFFFSVLTKQVVGSNSREEGFALAQFHGREGMGEDG